MPGPVMDLLERPLTKSEYESAAVANAIMHHRVCMAHEIDGDASGKKAATLRAHYRDNPADFAKDWVICHEPRERKAEGEDKERPAYGPFIPFPRQVEFLNWIQQRRINKDPGIVLKSRECGVSWLCAIYAINMWLFRDGASIMFATRKADELDSKGNTNCLFEKMRIIIDWLPPFLLPEDYNRDRDTPLNKIINRSNGSTITGMCGDEIGRGGRGTICFVDEAAFLEHQDRAQGALSQTTECCIRVSTPNASGDLFHKDWLRYERDHPEWTFEFNVRKDDPRKDEAWYQEQLAIHGKDKVAREIDRNFAGANEDAFIQDDWVNASVDAHKKLDWQPSHPVVVGFDPADTGHAKAITVRRGSVVTRAEQVIGGGEEKDIRFAVPWALGVSDEERADTFVYDGDGMGEPVMKMVKQLGRHKSQASMEPFRGGSKVINPDMLADPNDESSKKNKDTYYNRRSQAWSDLRMRFHRTYQAVQRAQEGKVVNFDPDMLISLDGDMKELDMLKLELSAPKRRYTETGKIQVEGKVDMRKRGVDSPNLADSLICAFSTDGNDELEGDDDLTWHAHTVYDRAAGF